jgi:ABC-type lipoprotein release transport system permease subunit
MITSLAWKNIWRNRSRSLVVLISVTLGTIAGVFVAGLITGWSNQRISEVIHTELGHIKLQNPAYLINEEISHMLPDVEGVNSFLSTTPEVEAYAFRSKVVAMATTARGNAGLVLKGVDPEKEKEVSALYKKLLPNGGSYFEKEGRLPQVIISAKTAEQLRIKNFRVSPYVKDSLLVLGVPKGTVNKLDSLLEQRFLTEKSFKRSVSKHWSKAEIHKYAPALMQAAVYIQPRARITFSFTNAKGNLAYQTYQVSGVYKTSNTMFDAGTAFVNHNDLAPVAGLLPNQFHEVSVVLSKNNDAMEQFSTRLKNEFPEISVLSWKELAPDAGMMADFMQVYYFMIMGIIFLALAFGIINTMLMAILERIKELGMLMAIGMKRFKVFRMIMLETVFLTLTGSVLGMALGALLINITGHTGLNFSSVAEGFEAIGWSAQVFPSIEPVFFFEITLMVILVGILSSIIPAQKALKLKPIDALRID